MAGGGVLASAHAPQGRNVGPHGQNELDQGDRGGGLAAAVSLSAHRDGNHLPLDLRQDPRLQPRALRPGEAEGASQGEEGDTLAARRRHQYWSADIRYVDNDRIGGRAYVVSVMDNHSRCVLASAITRTQESGSLRTTTPRATSPTASATTGGARRRRSWASLAGCAIARGS